VEWDFSDPSMEPSSVREFPSSDPKLEFSSTSHDSCTSLGSFFGLCVIDPRKKE
jgi:hypothetical protein